MDKSMTCLCFAVTSLHPLDKTLDRGSHDPASDRDADCSALACAYSLALALRAARTTCQCFQRCSAPPGPHFSLPRFSGSPALSSLSARFRPHGISGRAFQRRYQRPGLPGPGICHIWSARGTHSAWATRRLLSHGQSNLHRPGQILSSRSPRPGPLRRVAA